MAASSNRIGALMELLGRIHLSEEPAVDNEAPLATYFVKVRVVRSIGIPNTNQNLAKLVLENVCVSIVFKVADPSNHEPGFPNSGLHRSKTT